jgi:hypothetical protein
VRAREREGEREREREGERERILKMKRCIHTEDTWPFLKY